MGDNLIDDNAISTVYEAKGMLVSSFGKLFEFFQKEILCDVVIHAGQKSIKCHRVVLASCSPYFQAMFTSPLTESQQGSVTIGDIDEVTMELFINFAYTAKIELNISNAQSILHASSVLQLNALTQACCDFMSAHLHPTNCLGIRQFADQHGLFSLINCCDSFAKAHFKEILVNEEFGCMEAKHLEQLISSDDLRVNSEEEVFEAVMQWMSTNIERKKSSFAELMSRVRLPLLSLSYRHLKVESNDLIRNSFQCRDLLDEARDYVLWKASQLPTLLLPVNERTRPRHSYAGVIYCVGGRGSSGDPFATAEMYSIFHNKWYKLNSMSTSRRHVGCTSTEGKIYAVGGCNDKEHLKTAEMFHPLTGKWTPISPMFTARRGLGLCCLGGPIYAIGGMDDSVFFSTVERYDISSDIWSTVSSMNSARGGVAVAELNGFLYAFGGNSGPISLNTCEVYNPYVNKWTFVSPMKQCRAGAGATVVDGFVYIVGGFDNNVPLNSVEKYDPELDEWKCVASMKICRGGVGVAEIGKKIFAVGGHNGTNYLKTVEVYDPQADKWTFGTSISQCRAGAGIAWCPFTVDDIEENIKNVCLQQEASLS